MARLKLSISVYGGQLGWGKTRQTRVSCCVPGKICKNELGPAELHIPMCLVSRPVSRAPWSLKCARGRHQFDSSSLEGREATYVKRRDKF
ncbi:hypothetical protein TNCV_3961381 [Trichonephila clavipes]|nr:hypothetical protein TNCV_3961381 [Trichonephila clavipes]